MSDIVVLGGGSHPDLTARICKRLDIEATPLEAGKFSNGESNVKIKASVRKKRVYIIQTGGVHANDSLMELLILISACKSASANSVTVVLPLFPYSRQAEVKDALRASAQSSTLGSSCTDPIRPGSMSSGLAFQNSAGGSFLATPALPTRSGLGLLPFHGATGSPAHPLFAQPPSSSTISQDLEPPTLTGDMFLATPQRPGSTPRPQAGTTTIIKSAGNATSYKIPVPNLSRELDFALNTGYKFWIAQTGPFVSMLLNTAGANHIITMDLHDPQFQGFFDIPVDNLRAQPLLELYITKNIPDYEQAVIVSPDAGGAGLAASISDRLGLSFALLHKDRRNNATILVGDLSNRPAIIIDDLVDTGRTVVRAARLAKDHGACKVYALVIHGVFSGNAAEYIANSPISTLVLTDSVPNQHVREILGERFECLDISAMFAEAIRRIHNGESISMRFEPKFSVAHGSTDQDESSA